MLDFTLTPEQLDLVRVVRAFAARELAPRSRQGDRGGDFPWEIWRRLGEVNVDIDDPPAAVAAFKEAVARDPADIASLQAIAVMATRLGQPQEAKAALDRALAAQPGDAVSMCLRNGLGALPQARDAFTSQRQVQAVDSKCRGKGDATAVAVK